MRTSFSAVLLVLLAVAPVSAQAPAAREALLALRDSAIATDAVGLSGLRSSTVSEDQDRDLRRLRSAFLILRQGEVDSSNKLLRKAGEEFYHVTARHDDWPVAWYGIGLTERALARGRFPVLPATFHPLGADYNQGAIQAFVYALEKDSTFLPAAEGLADAVQATTRWGYTGKARDALRRASASSTQTLVVRARLEREDNHRKRAAELLQRSLQLGGDSSVTYFELAREQFALGLDSLAIDSYWEGVRLARSPEAVQMLTEQLASISYDNELAGFDTLPQLERTARVRRFWTIREVNAGGAIGSRLREHFQRYEVVSTAYRPRNHGMTPIEMNRASRMAAVFGYGPSPTTGGSYLYPLSSLFVSERGPAIYNLPKSMFGSDDPRFYQNSLTYAWDRPFGTGYPLAYSTPYAGALLDQIDAPGSGIDSRGMAYLRYGRPDNVAGNIWSYNRAGGPPLSIPVNSWGPGSLCDIQTKYCTIEMRGNIRPEELEAMRRELLAARDTINSTDRMLRLFSKDLDAAVDAYAMVDPGTGAGKILVAFAIPADQIEPDSTYAGFVYPVRVQLIAAPPSGAYRVERDTTRHFLTDRRLGKGEYLQATEIMPVAPANYHLRVVIQSVDSRRGSVGGDDTVDVRSVRRGIALSDIVLGRDGSGLTWWSGTDRLKLNPSGRIKRDEELHLYYQLGGLPVGRPYKTLLEVYHDTAPTEKPLISLSFDEIADQSVMEIQRVLELTRLDSGVHTIRLTIMDDQGLAIAQRHASVRVD